MIPHGVEIFVGLEPIDLRWGFERLAGAVSERLGRRARSGALFVFFGRRRQAVKVFFYDGSGLCVFYKRLDKSTFRPPPVYEEGVEKSDSSLLPSRLRPSMPLVKRPNGPKLAWVS